MVLLKVWGEEQGGLRVGGVPIEDQGKLRSDKRGVGGIVDLDLLGSEKQIINH